MPQTDCPNIDQHLSTDTMEKLLLYGSEVISSPNMQMCLQFPHHGQVTVFEHSIGVAYVSLALADFKLNQVEEDIIRKHMFPLTRFPPKYKESLLVCIADKICTVYEFFYNDYIATLLRYKMVGWQVR